MCISEVRTFCRSGIQVSGTSELAQMAKKEVSLQSRNMSRRVYFASLDDMKWNECHKWKSSRGSWSNCGTEGVPLLLAGILETSSLRAAGLAKLANQSETGLGRRERNTLVIDDEWAHIPQLTAYTWFEPFVFYREYIASCFTILNDVHYSLASSENALSKLQRTTTTD